MGRSPLEVLEDPLEVPDDSLVVLDDTLEDLAALSDETPEPSGTSLDNTLEALPTSLDDTLDGLAEVELVEVVGNELDSLADELLDLLCSAFPFGCSSSVDEESDSKEDE